MELVEKFPSLDSLIKQAQKSFEAHFSSGESSDGLVCGVAPGRVNLIGEHTDYNGGFVLPFALPLYTVVMGRQRSDTGDSSFRIVTTNEGCDAPTEVHEESTALVKAGVPKWANYCKGVVANFHRQPLPGFEAVIVSSVPLGGGVSSSASLEVAFYTFLEAMTGSQAPSLKDKALACQAAEHQFAGVPCGVMDQFVSTMAKENHALAIDCRSLEVEHVPFPSFSGGPDDGEAIMTLVTNSNVKHELDGSEYPIRRKQCEDAAKMLGISSLREASPASLSEALKANLFKDEVVLKRARHVVGEIERTTKAIEFLKSGNLAEIGSLLNESHRSLRDDFEVSCLELDLLVDAACKVDGVLGSRMVGGGFGGCTITLVRKKALPELLKTIDRDYKGQQTFYLCEFPVDGASILKVDK